MRLLRSIKAVSLRERQMNKTIREQFNLRNNGRWIKSRRTDLQANMQAEWDQEAHLRYVEITNHVAEDQKEERQNDGKIIGRQ